ncbi:MAG: hypothetical protein HYW22_00340 [Candidatus Aenigmarchaeota archaeon]|nr:hypothetical protein [Candidatus Aenigmarchaeota archaeon]
MSKRFVVCEVNESYLKNVKDQMARQNMPMPEDDCNITIAHRPIIEIDSDDLKCNCEVCSSLK